MNNLLLHKPKPQRSTAESSFNLKDRIQKLADSLAMEGNSKPTKEYTLEDDKFF